MPAVNVVMKLQPQRRRMALKCLQLVRDRIPASDNKKYAKGKAFVPIFPTDNAPLNDALALIIAQLNAVIYPTP